MRSAGLSFIGAVIAGSALGLAAHAGADDNCDPFMLSMTPQPVPACQPDLAPPPEAPAFAPANEVTGPLPAEVPPAPEAPPAGPVVAPQIPIDAPPVEELPGPDAPGPVLPPPPDAFAG